MDANKRRDQGWSSSEMPTALLVTLSAPRLCSPTLGCTCRNTCFLVCVQYWGGFPQLRYCGPPFLGRAHHGVGGAWRMLVWNFQKYGSLFLLSQPPNFRIRGNRL